MYFSVNEKLPVALTASDVEQYPQLVKLLEEMSQHLNKDGGLKSNQTELSEVIGRTFNINRCTKSANPCKLDNFLRLQLDFIDVYI